MSLDLDWALLDEALAQSLLTRLNNVFQSAKRPDFLGPISLTSLDFGEDAPDVRLTQVGDVWRQFLDRDDVAGKSGGSASRNAAADREGGMRRRGASESLEVIDGLEDEELEDLPENEGRALDTEGNRPGDHLTRLAEQSLPFVGSGAQRLQTFRNYTPSDVQPVYGGNGSIASFAASIPQWASGSTSVSNSGLATPSWGAGLGPRVLMPGNSSASGYFSHWQSNTTPPTPLTTTNPQSRTMWPSRSSSFARTRDGRSPTPNWGGPSAIGSQQGSTGGAGPPASSVPSLQLQFSVVWSTNTLRLGIDTSLLVNHPTPAFMELPVHVSMIGLGIQAGCVVAFDEGDGKGRKVHLSLVEDEEEEEEEEEAELDATGCRDPLGTTDDRSGVLLSARPRHLGPTALSSATSSSSAVAAPSSNGMPRPQRPPTIGERLLPHITLESSVGQADKHVLKNVGKVEKFLIELIRKAVEDELVWPNFYTIALP